jgi:hypothetical protein
MYGHFHYSPSINCFVWMSCCFTSAPCQHPQEDEERDFSIYFDNAEESDIRDLDKMYVVISFAAFPTRMPCPYIVGLAAGTHGPQTTSHSTPKLTSKRASQNRLLNFEGPLVELVGGTPETAFTRNDSGDDTSVQTRSLTDISKVAY